MPIPGRREQEEARQLDAGAERAEVPCPHALFENAFFENFANFWRARCLLYQNEILQENMRLTAFFKLYMMCALLHRSKFNILTKNRVKKSAIFVKIQ